MNRHTSKVMALAALAGLIAGLTGCRSMGTRSGMNLPDYPLDDQLGDLQKSVTFDVGPVAGRAPCGTHHWFFNGYPIDSNTAPALGVTGYDGPKLRIESASLTNCGFYSYQNDPGNDRKLGHKFSATAHLFIVSNLVTRTEARSLALQNGIVVYGTPIAGNGGGGTTCPGPYKGYASYPARLIRNGGQATDGNGAGNPVVYYGTPFSNMGCGPTIPNISCNYTFKIFFKGSVPSGPYPLRLVFY